MRRYSGQTAVAIVAGDGTVVRQNRASRQLLGDRGGWRRRYPLMHVQDPPVGARRSAPTRGRFMI